LKFKDGLEIWRVAANILNEQLQASNKKWSSSLELGEGLRICHCKKKQLVSKCYRGPQNWTEGPVVGSC